MADARAHLATGDGGLKTGPHTAFSALERREISGQIFAVPDDASDLPNDIAALRAMVLEHRAELAAARLGLMEQRHEIESLKARLSRLLRVTFGRSSEKLTARVEQLELFAHRDR